MSLWSNRALTFRIFDLPIGGADGLSLDEEGNLQIETPYGVLIDDRPISYQEINGRQVPVTSSFKLEQQKQGEKSYGCEVENGYDSHYPLIIDPGLSYSTYLGGTDFDQGLGIAIDHAGNAYVTGGTISSDFPTTPGAFQPTLKGGIDVFVTKFNPTGSALVYSTFSGGTNDEIGRFSIAVDGSGQAYVTGITISSDFPTTPGAFQTTLKGFSDAFVTKLNRTGSALVYSTFLGGTDDESIFTIPGVSIAVDGSGHAYVTGGTSSSDFPTTPGAFQTTFKGGGDAFVTKIPTLTTTTVCPIPNPQTCCQVTVEFKTQLAPPALASADVTTEVFFTQPPVVESVCPEKVIICGTVAKKITYTAVDEHGNQCLNVIYDERPFQCIIDREDANEGDPFEVCGFAVLCEGKPRLQNRGTRPGLTPASLPVDVFWKVLEKDIVKVCIRKNDCNDCEPIC